MTVLVGVDAGGSHTEAGIGGADLRRLATARGAPGHVRRGHEDEAARRIASVARRALAEAGRPEPAAALAVGAAGAGDPRAREALQRALEGSGVARRTAVTTDIAIALDSVFPGEPGIVLLAGTGSVAVGRDGDGTTTRVGGHGWRFGDEGSGYDMGRETVVAALRAIDGRGAPTSLTHALAETAVEAGDGPPRPNRAWLATADRPTIAALAPEALRAWEAGDAVAEAIVSGCVRRLAELVAPLAREPRAPAGAAVALGGGLLAHHRRFRSAVAEEIRRRVPGATVVETLVDPVLGALRLAAALHASGDAPASA